MTTVLSRCVTIGAERHHYGRRVVKSAVFALNLKTHGVNLRFSGVVALNAMDFVPLK